MLMEYFVMLVVAVMGLILVLATKSLGKVVGYYLLILAITLSIISVWSHVHETNTITPEDSVAGAVCLFLAAAIALRLEAWGKDFLGAAHSPTSEDLSSDE